jgi:hypothetical protein
LVADEKNATLSASTDGVTQVLRTINQVVPVKDGDLGARHNFACQLMMALSRGIGEHTYDGVIIFAEAQMMGELRKVKTGLVSRAIIAEVVRAPEVTAFPTLCR